MTISEQIRNLCIKSQISIAELARRLNTSPQNFNAKLKRESFTIRDLEKIAMVTSSEFRRMFVLKNGDNL